MDVSPAMLDLQALGQSLEGMQPRAPGVYNPVSFGA